MVNRTKWFVNFHIKYTNFCITTEFLRFFSLLGAAYRRCGFSSENECGTYWKAIEDAPKGITLKQISVGLAGIWAIDSQGQLLVRREVCDSFPEGSHWQILQNVPNDPPHEEGKIGFKSVSVSDTDVWAVSISNYVCKRSGVTPKNPAGSGWQLGINVSFIWLNIFFYFNKSKKFRFILFDFLISG